jgi:hypothetical protein
LIFSGPHIFKINIKISDFFNPNSSNKDRLPYVFTEKCKKFDCKFFRTRKLKFRFFKGKLGRKINKKMTKFNANFKLVEGDNSIKIIPIYKANKGLVRFEPQISIPDHHQNGPVLIFICPILNFEVPNKF